MAAQTSPQDTQKFRTKTPAGRGLVFVVSAPSGAGKSTVVDRVIRGTRSVVRSVSWTTRAPRGGERDGRDYHFVTEARFKRMIGQGGFVEWAKVVGCYYGTPKRELESHIRRGTDVICVIDVQGAGILKRKRPGTVLIFLSPPSIRELEKRLRGRGHDSEASIRHRLAVARRELSRVRHYDYCVVNDRVGSAVRMMKSILRAERSRT